MARIKYDIWMRPARYSNNYEIRFTNADAMKRFVDIAVKKGIYKPGYVCHYLNEWKGIPNALVNSIIFGIWSGYNIKTEYASISDMEHGVAA